ncbi:hypothetical protein AGMMS49975_04220 [Clostridia bacterium]|nr:hypothetical protein AGMMS49975_04220 [Clostridia bacterium]
MLSEQIKLSDRELLMSYIKKSEFLNSEYNFTVMFASAFVYGITYSVVENCLCARGVDGNGQECIYFPQGGSADCVRALPVLIEHMRSLPNCKLSLLSDKMLGILKSCGLYDEFSYAPRRDSYDYVYTRESLVNLSGKKLHGKRNHFNYFVNNYSYELRDITDADADSCRAFLKAVITDRSRDGVTELNYTLMMFDNYKELGLCGKLLFANGTLCGLVLAENHVGYALLHIARCDTAFRGASVALFKLFLTENLTDCEYVNFMEDIGLEGLRKAKLSYAPEFFIEKSDAFLKA